MTHRSLLLPALIALGLATTTLAGEATATPTIEGRVTLPERRSAPVVNQRYEIVSRSGVVATDPPVAIVYLAGTFAQIEIPPVQRMEQRDLMFEPRLLPVFVGTKVEFPNLDETYHNVFSYSRPKRFDLGRYRADEEPIPFQIFDTPGLVTIRCDIHEHMRAAILVLETPHFVITDTEGRYRLEGLPAGTHTLKAWISSDRTLEKPVELATDSVLTIDLP